MLVYFNIGLDDLPRITRAFPKDFTVLKLHRYSGEYLGNWENGYSFSAIVELYSHDMVADIAEKLGQECIAIYYPNFFQGEIIYSRLFTGERITFDPKYFHMPFINENVGRILTLYHGTCEGNGKNLIENGWKPINSGYGGNMGNQNYLYLSSEPEDALWFAEEKGCNTVIEIMNIPIDYLRPDPEDEAGFTMKELLDRIDTNKFPAKFILTKPLDNSHFKPYNI